MALPASRFTVPAAAAVLGFALCVVLRPFTDFGMLLVSDIVQLLAAAVSAIVIARAARAATGLVRVGWLCVAAMSASYGFGMVPWIVYQLVLGVSVPFPSLADVGFLAGVPLGLAGLLCLSPRPRSPAGWVRAGTDLLLATGLLLFVVWLLVVQPTLEQGGLHGLALAIAIAYPVGYALLGGMALRSVADTGANRRAMTLLTAGLVVQTGANLLYLYLLSIGAYRSGHLIDPLWPVALLMYALASLQADALRAPGSTDRPGLLRRAAPLAPFVAAVPIGLVQAGDPRFLVPVALASMGAVTLRQSFAFLEQRQIATGVSRAAARQRLMAASMSDAMLMITPDGRIPFVSPSLERFLGLPAEQIVPERLVERIGAEDRLRLATSYMAVLAGGAPEKARLNALSGQGWREVEVDISPVRDPELGEGAIVTFRDVSEQVEIERSLERAARVDPLTSLPNRTVFLERLEQVLHEDDADGDVVVLIMDLDHFKTVNDSLGHRVGDTLLATAAQRLATAVPGCFVARLGGDEFGVLSRQRSDSAPEDLATTVLSAFRAPLAVAGLEMALHCSVGVARGRDGLESQDLLQAADTALYAAKSEGRDRFALYSQIMGEAVRERLTLSGALPHALERGELEVWFQPLIELSTGRVSSLEALLRWRSPQHGMISPARFIPLAEESELIVDIGRWVLREACRQLAEWRDRHADRLDVSVAVNVSARQFQHPDLRRHVADALESAGLPPALLTVEVTESLVLSAEAPGVLNALRDLGVRIAMDDFGTGYSSLATLQRLPFDVLKLDRAFLTSIDERPHGGGPFLASIVSMAHSLNLRTVAEGVETAAHLRLLREAGVDKAQGFLFGRPAPPDEVEHLLRSGVELPD